MLLNRVWFSGFSGDLNRVYNNFTFEPREQGVFLDLKPFKQCENFGCVRSSHITKFFRHLGIWGTVLNRVAK